MKRFQPLVFSAALLLLAACGQDTQPEAAAPSFNFSIDPGSETVSLQGSGAAALSALTYGTCGSDDPRELLPDGELALTAYNAVFLPGNILEITASFTNVTGFDFEQPFTFTRATRTDLTRNIVSSQEPEVTDADLGGDGVLSPDETTSTLTFTVEHRGQPFAYKVLAKAVVRCGDDGGDPTDPTDATDPTDPTDATDPTDPTDATDPTEPTDPTDATDPTDPTDPGVTACVVSEGVTQEGNTITGTDGDDTIDCTGVEGDLTIDGLGGNDTITGGNGNDVLIGRDGNDTITGGPGDDCISGGEGNDTLTGSEGFNTIFPGPGENTVSNNTDPEGTVTGCTTDPALDPAPGTTDLAVTKDGGEAIDVDGDPNTATVTYNVNLANTGDVATAVTLTDVLDVDLSGAATVESVTITGSTLPAGCTAEAQVNNTLTVDCDLGDLADGTSDNLTFVFDLVFTGTFSAGDTALVTNTATAATTTEEPVTDNNSDSVQTILTPVASVEPDPILP